MTLVTVLYYCSEARNTCNDLRGGDLRLHAGIRLLDKVLRELLSSLASRPTRLLCQSSTRPTANPGDSCCISPVSTHHHNTNHHDGPPFQSLRNPSPSYQRIRTYIREPKPPQRFYDLVSHPPLQRRNLRSQLLNLPALTHKHPADLLQDFLQASRGRCCAPCGSGGLKLRLMGLSLSVGLGLGLGLRLRT